MEEIVKLLKSPSWWFSVVIVGLLVTFLKDILASFVVKLRRWLRTSREQRRKERLEEIYFLACNPDILTHEQNRCIMGLIRSTVLILVCVLLQVSLVISYGLTLVEAALGVTPDPYPILNIDRQFRADMIHYSFLTALLLAWLDLITNTSRITTIISASNQLKRQRKQNAKRPESD
jgi:hypothetical protein